MRRFVCFHSFISKHRRNVLTFSLCYFAIFVFVRLDLISKRVFFDIVDKIREERGLESEIIEVSPWFNLVHVCNEGVSFGIFAGIPQRRILLSIVAGLITFLLVLYLHFVKSRIVFIALFFVIAGAIGNLFDRVKYGYVRDFLDFHILHYHWPAFNLADIYVTVGVVLFVVGDIVDHRADVLRSADKR